jgi:hypothetical protein
MLSVLRLYSISDGMINECGSVGVRIGKGSGSTRRNPAQMPLCPPQIAHHLFLG